MSYEPTGAPYVIKKPQFVEEITEGTLPLDDGAAGSTTFRTIGWVKSLGPEITIQNNQVRTLGTFDVDRQVQLGEEINGSLEFETNAFGIMRYGMELPIPPSTTPANPGTGTYNNSPGVSVSILLSALIDEVESYLIFKGVRFAGCQGEITREGGFQITMPFRAKGLDTWVVEPSFSPAATYATDAVGDPWSGITSGADPLQVNSVVYDTSSFSFNVDLGVTYFSPNGVISFKFARVMQRSIEVTFNTLVKDNVLIGDVRSYTARPVVYTIASGKTLTFNNVKFSDYSQVWSGDSTDFAMEEMTGMPEGQAPNPLVIGDT